MLTGKLGRAEIVGASQKTCSYMLSWLRGDSRRRAKRMGTPHPLYCAALGSMIACACVCVRSFPFQGNLSRACVHIRALCRMPSDRRSISSFAGKAFALKIPSWIFRQRLLFYLKNTAFRPIHRSIPPRGMVTALTFMQDESIIIGNLFRHQRSSLWTSKISCRAARRKKSPMC